METDTKSLDVPLVKEVYGRQLSNINDQYLLPLATDEEEATRLDKQDLAIKLTLGGLYLCPEVVERLLYPEAGASKRVLDAGCGTGRWAIEMARRFPHVSVLGIDLAPHPPNPDEPENVWFQVYDLNEGMVQFYGQYDMIQMRCVMGGITDIERTVKELLLSLKPGGLLILIDGDRLMKTDRTKVMAVAKIEGDEVESNSSYNGSWLARISYEASTANAISGADIVRARDVLDLGLWDHPLCDPETAGGGSLCIPIGPWMNDSNTTSSQRLQLAGSMLQKVFLSSHIAWHPILLKHGMKGDVLREWSQNIDNELRNLTHKMWCRYRYCFARRRPSDGSKAPSLPSPPSFSRLSQGLSDLEMFREDPNLEESLDLPYPALDSYKDRNHALIEMKRRNEMLAKLPKAAVAKCWEEQKRTMNSNENLNSSATVRM
ncbi:S-adenosyl-L-methionine-dependent methyltransferase [Serendipita vermifera]|nr:S-adenosyl-L-methionine-dependent methyltransferase [Serendipita vermifera]